MQKKLKQNATNFLNIFKVFQSSKVSNAFFDLFPLHGGGGFLSDIIDHAVDAFDLVCNSAWCLCEDFKGNFCPIAGHKIVCCNGSESNQMVIGSWVAHYAHALCVGYNGEILVDASVKPCGGDFFSENCVRISENFKLILCDFSEASYGKAGTGEGLAVNEKFGNSELKTDLSYLVFKQIAERLYYAVKINILRQTAYIVMALDNGGVARAALYRLFPA